MRYLAQPFGVAIEERIHDDRAACISEKFRAQANHPPARDAKFNSYAPRAMIVHSGYLAFARADLLNHYADKRLRYINGEFFHRLHEVAIHLFRHNLRLAYH